MKAETLKQFLLNKYPTNEYFDCPVPKHHWEVIQEYAEHYARIQIEKDREDAALKACQYGIGYNEIKIEQAIKDRPINLD